MVVDGLGTSNLTYWGTVGMINANLLLFGWYLMDSPPNTHQPIQGDNTMLPNDLPSGYSWIHTYTPAAWPRAIMRCNQQE